MLEFNGDDDLFVGDEILKEFGDCCDCGCCNASQSEEDQSGKCNSNTCQLMIVNGILCSNICGLLLPDLDSLISPIEKLSLPQGTPITVYRPPQSSILV